MDYSYFSGKKIVLTGCAGFLGTHVLEILLENNAFVIGIDNLEWGNEEFINKYINHKNFVFKRISISDLDSVSECFSQDTYAVIHLAALHYIPDAIKNPTKTIDYNVKGTQVLLEASRKSNCKFWFASTGDVYTSSESKLIEDVTDTDPFNIYGLSKLLGEKLIKLESMISVDKTFFIGRIFNLYGPRETNPHFIPEMVKQLKKAKSSDFNIKVGDLSPLRDMVYIEDAAKALLDTLKLKHKGVSIFNLATGNNISMAKLLDHLSHITNIKINTTIDPARLRKVDRACLDPEVKKLKKMIGWVPSPDIVAGLEKMFSIESI